MDLGFALFAQAHQPWASVAQVAVAVSSLYMFCRLLFWLPLVVDSEQRVWSALQSSVRQTRGHVCRLLAFIVSLGIPLLIALLAVSRWPAVMQLAWVLAFPVILLCYSRLYIALCGGLQR
jgi:membrane-anchored glycerophosphoryl diester phosphodiesterase (GDPDase)